MSSEELSKEDEAFLIKDGYRQIAESAYHDSLQRLEDGDFLGLLHLAHCEGRLTELLLKASRDHTVLVELRTISLSRV
jgi:hypothetical protein